jgi:hypothetical protein
MFERLQAVSAIAPYPSAPGKARNPASPGGGGGGGAEGAVTVMTAVSAASEKEAAMRPVPVPTAVTRPDDVTVATRGSRLLQVGVAATVESDWVTDALRVSWSPVSNPTAWGVIRTSKGAGSSEPPAAVAVRMNVPPFPFGPSYPTRTSPT